MINKENKFTVTKENSLAPKSLEDLGVNKFEVKKARFYLLPPSMFSSAKEFNRFAQDIIDDYWNLAKLVNSVIAEYGLYKSPEESEESEEESEDFEKEFDKEIERKFEGDLDIFPHDSCDNCNCSKRDLDGDSIQRTFNETKDLRELKSLVTAVLG